MIIKIVATAAIAAVLSLILKQYRPEYSVVLQVCAGGGDYYRYFIKLFERD